MKFSLVADAANTGMGIFGVAPVLMDVATASPYGDAGKDLVKGIVGILLMLGAKAAGKLLDKWFPKKEAPQVSIPPQPETLTLNKTTNDGNKNSK